MIGVGDTVQCTQRPGMDDHGRPFEQPVVGEIYTVTSIYRINYGLGCTLEGLNPKPYRGYILCMQNNRRFPDMPLGWYFKKLVPVDIKKFTTVGESQDNERIPVDA